jgi:hypothetical protein
MSRENEPAGHRDRQIGFVSQNRRSALDQIGFVPQNPSHSRPRDGARVSQTVGLGSFRKNHHRPGSIGFVPQISAGLQASRARMSQPAGHRDRQIGFVS